MMGSDSDFTAMTPCLDVLDGFGIEYEACGLSAHRAPDVLAEWVRSRSHVSVFIAAAGMAAALPGAVAGHTRRPVIGIPLDEGSIPSILRMPPGMSLATMDTGKSGVQNAAYLAAQILALSDPDLDRRVAEWFEKRREGAMEKHNKVVDSVVMRRESERV